MPKVQEKLCEVSDMPVDQNIGPGIFLDLLKADILLQTRNLDTTGGFADENLPALKVQGRLLMVCCVHA